MRIVRPPSGKIIKVSHFSALTQKLAKFSLICAPFSEHTSAKVLLTYISFDTSSQLHYRNISPVMRTVAKTTQCGYCVSVS